MVSSTARRDSFPSPTGGNSGGGEWVRQGRAGQHQPVGSGKADKGLDTETTSSGDLPRSGEKCCEFENDRRLQSEETRVRKFHHIHHTLLFEIQDECSG
jgi:hypothetical protein